MSAAACMALDEIAAAIPDFDTFSAASALGRLEHVTNAEFQRVTVAGAEKVLKQLLANRWFGLADRLAVLFRQRGLASATIRRLSAQAWLDNGRYFVALPVLDALVDGPGTPEGERREALGLRGRFHKQLYIETLRVERRHDLQRLQWAIDAYLRAFDADPARSTWPGVNAVALLARAERDGHVLNGREPRALAQRILGILGETQKLESWDRATAAEAHLALGDVDAALNELREYVGDGSVSAFHLGSTLRQLREVWQVGGAADDLAQLLQARLLEVERGALSLSAGELARTRTRQPTLEKVFGDGRFDTLRNYRRGLDRASCVARISRDASIGTGTGFVLPATYFPWLEREGAVLLTNAHVLSDDDSEALRPAEGVVTFEALDEGGALREFRIDTVLWSSPRDRLDTCVATLVGTVPIATPYPLARALPLRTSKASVRIVGHPAGGNLAFSFDGGVLRDHDDTKIHYTTPTEGGSSGSPVFNAQWELIGVHHAGSDRMQSLAGGAAAYEANEAHSMPSILEAFRAEYRAR